MFQGMGMSLVGLGCELKLCGVPVSTVGVELSKVVRGIWPVLHSNPTPTFSHTSPSVYTASYETPDTWDCITIVSDFPNTIPAHPFDILPRLAPKPFNLVSLLHSWPYSSHRFTEFCPYCMDGDPTEL